MKCFLRGAYSYAMHLYGLGIMKQCVSSLRSLAVCFSTIVIGFGMAINPDAVVAQTAIVSKPTGIITFSQTHLGIDRTPRYSPNGAFIVYSSGGGVHPGADAALRVPKSHWDQHIFVTSFDGRMGTQLTTHPHNFEPAYSPDGKKIVFVSTRNGNEEIYVMKSDGTEQTRLTHDPSRDSQPAWSPDGKFIAWVSNRSAKKPVEYREDAEPGNEIYRMNADGTGQRRLTKNVCDDRKPQWLKALSSWK